MNKYEFELKKLGIQADKFGIVMNFLQHLCTLGAVVLSLYLILQGLEEMVKSNPAALEALATVIEQLHINAILGYVLTAGAGLGYVYERSGKKRAIRKLDQMRIEHEGADPYKSSSNLDENGHTPKLPKH